MDSNDGDIDNESESINALQALYSEDNTMDIKFIFPDCQRLAHKYVLALGSTVFEKEFQDEGMSDRRDMPHTSSEYFLPFLRTFYRFDIQINKKNVEGLLRLAVYYEAQLCMNQCIRFLLKFLSVDTVCFVLDLAWRYSFQVLMAVNGPCMNVIYENYNLVLESKGFSVCTQSTLRTILQLNPSDRCETKVIEAVVKWTTKKCFRPDRSIKLEDRRQAIGNDFCSINFKAMTMCDFLNCEPKLNLLTSQEIDDLLKYFSKSE